MDSIVVGIVFWQYISLTKNKFWVLSRNMNIKNGGKKHISTQSM